MVLPDIVTTWQDTCPQDANNTTRICVQTNQPADERSFLQCVEAVHDVPTIHGFPKVVSKCSRENGLHSAKQPLPVDDHQFVTSIRSQLNTFDPRYIVMLLVNILGTLLRMTRSSTSWSYRSLQFSFVTLCDGKGLQISM